MFSLSLPWSVLIYHQNILFYYLEMFVYSLLSFIRFLLIYFFTPAGLVLSGFVFSIIRCSQTWYLLQGHCYYYLFSLCYCYHYILQLSLIHVVLGHSLLSLLYLMPVANHSTYTKRTPSNTNVVQTGSASSSSSSQDNNMGSGTGEMLLECETEDLSDAQLRRTQRLKEEALKLQNLIQSTARQVRGN